MIPSTIIDQQNSAKNSAFTSLDIDYIIALENRKPEFHRIDEQDTVLIRGLRSDAEYMAEIKYSHKDIHGKPEYFKFKTQGDQARDKPDSSNKQEPDFLKLKNLKA